MLGDKKKLNKKTRTLSIEEYELIINTIRNGFNYTIEFRPNERIANILILEANLGVRIGDLLNLKLMDFVKDGKRYRLDIIEEKNLKLKFFLLLKELFKSI